MVFMSLLLGAALATLFSPSKPAQMFREALAENRYRTIYFWAGIFLCISIGMTLSTLLANFTAWAIIGAVHSANSHAVLRSSIGLYAAQLPARMVVLSIYCFVIWVVLFLFELLPVPWSFIVVLFTFALVMHIVVVYSAFGRLVMFNKAMRKDAIFQGEEDSMTPQRLFEELLKRALEEKGEDTPLPLHYRRKTEIRRQVSKLVSEHGMSLDVDGGIGESISSHLSSTLCKIMETPEIGSMDSNRRTSPPVVGFSDNSASIADSLAEDGLVLTENTTANEEHPLKRNGIGNNRGMSAGHHRGYSAGGALGGHYRSPSGGRGRGHKRESSGILLQRTLPPQSPAL